MIILSLISLLLLPQYFVNVKVVFGASTVHSRCVNRAKSFAHIFAQREQVAVTERHRDYRAYE